MTKICDTIESQWELYGEKNEVLVLIERKNEYQECVDRAKDIIAEFPFTPEYNRFYIYKVETSFHRILFETRAVNSVIETRAVKRVE